MATPTHISVNNEKIRVMNEHLEQFVNSLNATVASTITMIGPGDGSQDSDYTVVKTNFGYATDDDAHRGVNEMEAIQGKLQLVGDQSQNVNHVADAIYQYLAKFRQV